VTVVSAIPTADDLKALLLADPAVVLEDRDVMRALIDANQAPGGRNVVDLRGARVLPLIHIPQPTRHVATQDVGLCL